MEDDRFFASLFDVSFTRLITTKVVKVIFILSLALAGLLALTIFAAGISSGSSLGAVAAILVAPLYFLLVAIYVRVFLEVLVVLFRINENVARIATVFGQGATSEQLGREGPLRHSAIDRLSEVPQDLPSQPVEQPTPPAHEDRYPPASSSPSAPESVQAQSSDLMLPTDAWMSESDQLDAQAETPSMIGTICGRCGNQNQASNRFCESCGASL